MRPRIFAIFALSLALLLGCDQAPKTGASASETATGSVSADPNAAGAGEGDQVQATHNLKVVGSFGAGVGDPSGLPEDAPQRGLARIEITPELAASLNAQRDIIVEQVMIRRGFRPATTPTPGLPTLVVELGESVPADPKRPMTHRGLLIRVDLQRTDGTHRAASRQLPPASNGGELITNFDHTLDTLIQMATEQRE